MKALNIRELNAFVNKNIVRFHKGKINSLAGLNLRYILKKKNPYLFKAKNIHIASDLIREILDAFLSSSEEEHFGKFLEELAIFVASRTINGKKSAATGIDLEFVKGDIHYLVSIKSGSNWGNSAQHRKQESDFQNAVRVLKQSKAILNVQPVLGICYGKTRTSYIRGYMKVVGQNFWYLISGNENLYKDIIEPLGYKAKEHNDEFLKEKGRMINLFTQQFIEEFCEDSSISWEKLVEFNSGNLDITI
jgi:hypothetical protein